MTAAKLGVLLGAVLVALAAVFFANSRSGSAGASDYSFEVASPGAGVQAPPIALASTTGGTYNLASQRGKTVLLFFQEGIGCEACWTNIQDIEKNWTKFQALGIDKMVVVTGNPLDQLRQKVADEGIRTPVLADPGMGVSQSYNANQYTMMGSATDGHTFMVVGKDGVIKWRADYGGPPKYTMYVPVPVLLDQIKSGIRGKTAM